MSSYTTLQKKLRVLLAKATANTLNLILFTMNIHHCVVPLTHIGPVYRTW